MFFKSRRIQKWIVGLISLKFEGENELYEKKLSMNNIDDIYMTQSIAILKE